MRALLVSSSVILLCTALVIGITFALFTDSVNVTQHLKAGDMNMTLTRTKLVTYSLDDETGYLRDTEDSTRIDFSDPTDRNVFDIDNGTRIVPGAYYEATMEVANSKATSDTTFAYWIEVKLDTTQLTEEQLGTLKLDEQMKITVISSAGTIERTLDQGLLIGSKEEPIGILAMDTTDSFDVKVEFLDLPDNNAAKTQNLSFDLIVYAVQVITTPETP